MPPYAGVPAYGGTCGERYWHNYHISPKNIILKLFKTLKICEMVKKLPEKFESSLQICNLEV